MLRTNCLILSFGVLALHSVLVTIYLWSSTYKKNVLLLDLSSEGPKSSVPQYLPHTRLEQAQGNHYLGAIGVFSAFDWEPMSPHYVSFLSHRNYIRKTWMRHPACRDGRLICYFILGNQPLMDSVWEQSSRNSSFYEDRIKGNASELAQEMLEHGDIVLLPSVDHYNFGKANHWWKWATQYISADFHWKGDEESYLHIDNLLGLLSSQKQRKNLTRDRILLGWHVQQTRDWGNVTNTNIRWATGWGYGFSSRLLLDMQACIMEKGNYLMNHGEHEDAYVGQVIRMCGLDNGTDAVQFENIGGITSLWILLSNGCRDSDTQSAIALHCGAQHGIRGFRPFPAEVFYRLHDIYYPSSRYGIQSSSLKWASLWYWLFEVIGICRNDSDWECNGATTSRCDFDGNWKSGIAPHNSIGDT